MDLLVFRHAKSSWADPTLADYDRPLKKRGKRDAVRMGLFLKETGLEPDMVLSSTAERAAQTVRRALKVIGTDNKRIHWARDLYHAEPEHLLSTLAKLGNGAKRILLVGHNPGLEDLIILLCAEKVPIPPDGKLLPTAALAHLEIPSPWEAIEPGRARLKSLTRPKWLASPQSSL